MHELGVGLRPVPFFDLTGDDVTAAVHEAPRLRPRAAELAAQERADDGAATLAAWLESAL